MVLFSFSNPNHISLILSAQKCQTTRQPRKPRKNGANPYSVGEKVQLYYRSRQGKICGNCLKNDFAGGECIEGYVYDLSPNCTLKHSNFFGESVITEIVHYWDGEYKREGNELWEGAILHDISDEEKEAWAIADGFRGTENLTAWGYAYEWFTKSTGDPFWAYRNLDVIKWKFPFRVGEQ